MRKLSTAHQAQVDVYRASERERLAYHHALHATLNKTIQRVGSVYDKGDSHVWLIAFSPRLKDAVIVETFKSHAGDTSTRVFWLDDLRKSWTWGSSYCTMFTDLYGKAQQMERKEQEST